MVAAVEDYKQSSLGWQQANLKIITKKAELRPLIHNGAQLKVGNAIALQQKYHLPIMLIILKARQRGISTYIEACIFEKINRRANAHGCIASADRESTDKVFRMTKTFQEEMPAALRRKTEHSSKKEIVYAPPHRSSMLCQTAGKKVLGRGGTTQYVHGTEVAFWERAAHQLVGLRQEVPKNDPDTMIVLESTANGVGGAFYDEYWAAVARLRNDPHDFRGYLPIFLSWQDEPEYKIPLPKGYRSVPNMTPEIEEYVKEGLAMGISLTPEQIYFALQTIQNDCGGDVSRFKAEYPRTAREAFQSTGRMVFRPIDLDIMAQHCKEPLATIEFYEVEGKVKYRHVNRSLNSWSIWKWPIKHHSYCCFADVAEGILSDTKDTKSDPDRSVAGMMNRNEFDVPATYYGRPDTIEFADQMIFGSKFYNYAWASPEMNSIGMSVLDAFKRADYPFIYQREHKEETIQREDSSKLGWKTTLLTRKPMIADLQTVTQEHGLKVYDIRFIDEMRVFIWNPQGKPQAETGEHDDCVITLAGLIQLHQRCPFNEDLSWDTSEYKPETNIAVMGAVAPPDDQDELDLLYEDMSDYE